MLPRLVMKNSLLKSSVLFGSDTLRITRKEITVFFSSPMAYLFLGTFVAVTLFVFFWAESFFSRNIADVRPMFEWMPILLVFLSAALTMRMWSDEKRLGTLEFVLTVPVKPIQFIIGKFYACVALLIVALLLTLPLPISVGLIANLDWGPVIAAYLATILLGSAYMSIGLFVSAFNDNQIVSLIVTSLVCAVFYLVGSDAFTALFGNNASGILRQLGTGSRFESITRGVLDFRDLYYYLSIVIAFIALNALALERLRWANDGSKDHHWRWRNLTLLIVINVLMANVWMSSITWLRKDITTGGIYSISNATKNYLSQLKEPLLIRGYFSTKTHPLLAPLIPQMRDLIAEYQIAGEGRVRSEFIDPVSSEEIEEEASSKYGIRPVPLQVADRYQQAMVNSYFNVVVQYGDEFEVLDFNSLIEIKVQSEGNPDVKLRNPEYDITRSIKRVLYDYQAAGDLFENIKRPLKFTGYMSEVDRLPAGLAKFRPSIETYLRQLKGNAGDKFDFEFVDPHQAGSEVANEISNKYGFHPMMASLFENKQFYFYMVVSDGEQTVKIPMPEHFEDVVFEEAIESAIKKFAPGFMKTVGAVAPIASAYSGGDNKFEHLHQLLNNNLAVKTVDLGSGVVPADIDVLLLISPDALDEQQLFAVDQFLMEGGTVVMATSPFTTKYAADSLLAEKHESGLTDWLKHNGVEIPEKLIMDSQNSPFPVPVARQAGGVTMQEMRLINYPYFVDVRDEALNESSSITRGLEQVIMAWPSPILWDKEKNHTRHVTELLHSSEKSWANSSTQITPTAKGVFVPQGDKGPHVLGLAVEGVFTSYFSGKELPSLKTTPDGDDGEVSDTQLQLVEQPSQEIKRLISKSPESARLVIFASNEFLDDQAIQLSGRSMGTEYQKPLEMVLNALEWSLEDEGLSEIRGRSHFSRTLPPFEKPHQQMIEYLNYALAITGVLLVLFLHRTLRKKRQQQYELMLLTGDD